MKKISILIILIIFTIFSYSQNTISVEIINISYSASSNTIDSCGIIDLEAEEYVPITFDILLTRGYDFNANDTYNNQYGAGTVYIKLASSTNGMVGGNDQTAINSWDWFQNSATSTQTITLYGKSVNLNSSEYGLSDNYLYVTYSCGAPSIPQSCEYEIIKDEVPAFQISPSSTTVSCGSTTPKHFNVLNTNNSPGTLEYEWSVSNGWKNTNGDVVYGVFTTSSSNLTLVPYQYPPSNVHVTPKLDGVPYEQLTSNVSLGSFNTNNQIVGNSAVCSTENYHLQNALPNGWSVNWSLESTNIASITQNGNNATVTRNTNQSGEVTIKATFTNSCNQTVSKTLDVFVGHQPVNLNNIIGDEEICSNETKTYRINIPTCIGDVNWSVSPNLHITDESYDYITVEENYNSTSNFGYVNVNIPDLNINLEKIVFVGVPLNSEQLFIRKISSYNLYSYRWSKFKVHPMIDFDDIQESLHFEWLIPNSQVRHFTDTSIIDIKPNSLGVLNIGVRACNDCGCGNWKYKTFNVISTPSNGNGNNITEIIRPR